MVMLAKTERVVINGPHLFLVSIGQGRFLESLAINAMTWQDACVEAAVQVLSLEGLTVLMRDKPDADDWITKFPTIASLQEVLWQDKVSLHIAMIRPEVAAMTTGYEESADGPVSSTTTKVAVRIIAMDVGTVYVKE